jgi:SAM-dependent methyltransferase
VTGSTVDQLESARCLVSGAADVVPVLSMGDTPLADILLREDQLATAEATYPLEVGFSPSSALLQVIHTVSPDLAYDDDYPYYTSAVPELVEHFGASARRILAERALGGRSLVVEAASNDGYMLRVFAERGVPVLGVDAASGPVGVARAAGIDTIHGYFTAELARELRRDRAADVVLANNLLNLVPDPNDFAVAVRELLRDDGVAVLEVPYAVDLIDHCVYDAIFHQNLSYWTLTAMDRLFRRHDLGIVHVDRVPTMGGSLRVELAPGAALGPAAVEMLTTEAERGVAGAEYYADFGRRAEASRDALVSLLEDLHAAGSRIVAYGAGGGMATTLLTYAGLDNRLIEYAVDSNPHKHGRYTPGSRLRIYPPERLREDRPDYVLLLAWNYRDAILASQREYRQRGGRFIVPVPGPEVIA